MEQGTGSLQKIAKNTGIVYLRMFLLIVIAFYTSRILLKTLGITDFGVYSVVGSISSTFVAIKSLFSESIQRYLNVSKGKSQDSIIEEIDIFNISIVIHIVLLVVFVFIVEVVGLWLLNNKLDIPADRCSAAFFVFQTTIIATSVSILSIPYDAVIIANERMGFYAAITVLDGLLKLLFVYLLPIIGSDYLKTYSLLLVFIPVSTLIIQFYYCKRFKECRYTFKFEKALFKDIFSLSGWNFFGNISFSLIHEGINMLLNIFGGVIMNSARAIAYQIRSVTSQLISNTMLAVRPSIMQRSVNIDKISFFDAIITLSRISFFIILIPVSVLIVYASQILDIWLDIVPEYAVIFTRIVLCAIIVRSLHDPLNIMYMSFGRIKRLMIIESLTMLVFFFIVYFVLNSGAPIWSPFVVLAIMELVIIIFISCNAKLEFGFPLGQFVKRVIFPMFIIVLISGLVLCIVSLFFTPHSFFMTIINIITSIAIEAIICYIFMEQKERHLLYTIIRKQK